MHIVFIVGSYYPYSSAVGKCVGNVADVLAQNHKVTIICEKSYLNQQDEETYNNQRILRMITSDKIKREKVIEQVKIAKGIKKSFFNILLSMLKLYQASKLVFSKASIKSELVSTYLSKIRDINESIDVIIPSSMPFESVIAAYQYKEKINSEVKLVPYLFDQFVENEALHRFKLNKLLKMKTHQKIERNIVFNSEKIFIMRQLRDYYTSVYPEYTHLFKEVEHPLIVKNNSMSVSARKSKIVFTYTGGFYKNIRDPKYMLKVFDKFLDEINGVLNLYTFGNCENTINEYACNNKSIKANGSIPSNMVRDALSDADFLVAVGNSVSNQVPSKIFEYLSFGKPIIYFFEIYKDSNLKILEKYPYSICVNQKDMTIEESSLELILFCENNKNKIIPFKEISEIYSDALPEYTAHLIEETVLNSK